MNIFNYFSQSTIKYPENHALFVDEKYFTYKEIKHQSGLISDFLNKFSSNQVGILSYRSLTAYTSVLAILQSGKTYVPLNPKFPAIRNQKMIELSQSDILIVDNKCIDILLEIHLLTEQKLILVFPETSITDIPPILLEHHSIFTIEELREVNEEVIDINPNENAYILFTSGSTGIPKGVAVSHKNVSQYVDYLSERYEFIYNDKFSQTFDLTFDLSVHDMFLCWNAGATLYSIPENILLAPAKFIKESGLTVWFSVPSLAQFMDRFRMLKTGVFPELRYSFFCGEPLPKSIAVSWQKAAENSIIENIYGPTEATIGITHHRIPRDENKIKEKNGIVSIGTIFETQFFCLINEQNIKCHNVGELCLSGSQITNGYWKNQSKTEEQFVNLDDTDTIWYKTGDLVEVIDNEIYYLSRKDFQVKIRGYRIELDEINLAISSIIGTSLVYTIPFPIKDGVASSLYSFIPNQCLIEEKDVLFQLSKLLPEYMIPKKIIYINEFPLNSNGKIDRNALTQLI